MSSLFGKIFRGDDGERDSGAPLPGEAERFLPGGQAQAYRVVRTVAGAHRVTGERVMRSGVGVSLRSLGEAEQLAQEQAQRTLEVALAGRKEAGVYGYLVDRRLEPLVEVLHGAAGEAARITVNGYGALVMNATRALFVDADTEDAGENPRPGDPPRELANVLARRSELRFRTYRTRAGWRFLCTNQVFDPTSAETQTLLADLGADPKYIALCRVQKSFRARLTPKPWRAGYGALAVAATGGIARRDLQRYVDGTWDYATARHVGGAERDETALELQPLVEYHDRWKQATSGKPLA